MFCPNGFGFYSNFFFLILIQLGYIDSGRRDRAVLLTLLLIISMAIVLVFLPSFWKNLKIVKVERSYWNYQLWVSDFRFFYFLIFYYLSLSFSRNSLHWSITLIIVLVSIAIYWDLYLGFSFSANSFFDQSVLIISFLVFFIYLQSDQYP